MHPSLLFWNSTAVVESFCFPVRLTFALPLRGLSGGSLGLCLIVTWHLFFCVSSPVVTLLKGFPCSVVSFFTKVLYRFLPQRPLADACHFGNPPHKRSHKGVHIVRFITLKKYPERGLLAVPFLRILHKKGDVGSHKGTPKG